ncbi:hypothetical protein EXIGLDRAFT_729826 [Exidia glandulosa HHB12029]|uniref:C2H2-type domain-containing protein n=1 Tax=Exidia glandulosa HHB12029 TaxID=1314781 RepID=A0A165CFC9_EXIGL|nr:hypothetical protein EXIGLDRAFT_729826 [Exidia glandulosa HHB12029]
MPRQSSKTALPGASAVDHLAATAPSLDLEARKKKHLCQTCNRGFTTSGHLSRHQRVHTGERNHACPFPGCNTRCSRQDNLQQHYRVHLSARSRNISTSAARQAMARRQSEAGGVINTGSITPPPLPADLERGSPPPPASLAYRSSQGYHNGARSPDSPPHPAAIAAAMSGPVGALQPINTSTPPYPSYLPRSDMPGPLRTNASAWSSSSHYPADRSRNDYDNQPLSPISASSTHSHSPLNTIHPDMPQRAPPPPHSHSHVRQYSTSSQGSLQDGSGSEVSAPSFMEPAFDPGANSTNNHYLQNMTYSVHHHSSQQHPSSSARVQSPPPILPPIFTNSRHSLGGLNSHGSPTNGGHHYSGSHAQGGSA